MGGRKSDDGGNLAKGFLLFVAFMFFAWPYYLGTWLAVQFGADNPSTVRDVTGWMLESLWLISLVSIAAAAWLAKRREETEARRRELEKQRRKTEFGSAGAHLYTQAEESVSKIAASEAARTGWLGDPADLDFRADLTSIASNLRRAQEIRNVTAEADGIKHFTESDKRMLSDAQRAVKKLEESVRQRVTLIGQCARQAEDIDQQLRDDRERADMSKRRQDLRSRLSPILYGAENLPPDAPSESADVVAARATAFHELRALIDKYRIETDGN